MVEAAARLIEDVHLEVGADSKRGDLFPDPVLILGLRWIDILEVIWERSHCSSLTSVVCCVTSSILVHKGL